MKTRIIYEGTFPLLECTLDVGEKMKAESDAMVTMSPTVDVAGNLEGGILGGLGRMLSGEKFFFQTLTATRGPGTVLLAPTTIGDIVELPLDGQRSYNVQKDGFFAGSMDVQVSTKAQNLSKGLFSGEGFFILKIAGKGRVFVNSLGCIHPIKLVAGEQIIIDNGHLVAWEDTTNYKIEKAAKGWISSLTSGEMLVTRFTGPGMVYIQTRNPRGFAGFIGGLLPSRG